MDGLALVVISSELDEIVRLFLARRRHARPAMVAELHGADINPGVIVQAIAAQSQEASA